MRIWIIVIFWHYESWNLDMNFRFKAKVVWWVVIESKPHQGRCSNLLCHIKSMRSGAKLISSQFSKSFFDDITPDGVNVPAAELNLTQWLTLHYTNQIQTPYCWKPWKYRNEIWMVTKNLKCILTQVIWWQKKVKI